MTLRFVRKDISDSDCDVVRTTGKLHVVRQPPPESIESTLTDRAGALLESPFK